MAAHRQFITQGRVMCPQEAHDIDAERCFACPYFQGLVRSRQGPTAVACGWKNRWHLWA
ncbi:MAG: hypothetical protein K6U87_07525 [Firmicutes bacterium]|nr:hypothetical protein [Bacillota bacterium]